LNYVIERRLVKLVNFIKEVKEEWLNTSAEVFGKVFLELADNDKRIVFVGADTFRSSGIKEFVEKYPDRTFDVGIAEQNAIGFCAGLAFDGKKPFFSAIANFLTFRCYEQIRNDLAKPGLNVVLVSRGSGIAYAYAGPTHNTTDEIGALRVMPGITIFDPGDVADFENAIRKSIELKGPIYIRSYKALIRKINPEGYDFKFGKGVVIKEGKDIFLIASGTMVYQSFIAAQILETKGISAGVVNMHTIKPVDEELINDISSRVKKIVTVEEHSIINGLGSAVSEVLVKNCGSEQLAIGFPDEYPVNGPYEELLEFYELSGSKIAARVSNFLNK